MHNFYRPTDFIKKTLYVGHSPYWVSASLQYFIPTLQPSRGFPPLDRSPHISKRGLDIPISMIKKNAGLGDRAVCLNFIRRTWRDAAGRRLYSTDRYYITVAHPSTRVATRPWPGRDAVDGNRRSTRDGVKQNLNWRDAKSAGERTVATAAGIASVCCVWLLATGWLPLLLSFVIAWSQA